MPRKRPTPLPEPLGYMQLFVNWLATLPADSLNEDIDASRLEKALRRRLRGLGRDEAERELEKDREALESWLETEASPDHPAHWVLGFLQGCLLWAEIPGGLGKRPARPPEPVVTLEAPHGWKAQARSWGLVLTKGNAFCSVGVHNEFGFQSMQRSRDQSAKAVLPPDLQATRDVREVQFGDCVGKKYLYHQTGLFFWKETHYLLRVPGGYVSISMGMTKGADFDESPLEAKFHTLRTSPSA